MAKNLNVNLTFTANTQQAKMQLQQLQVQLNSLVSNSSLGLNLTKDIREGISAASQLKNMLQSATNVDTGKLNLSQFNQQLIQSGMTLGQFGSKMSALGTTGQQAFQNIARAVASAEVPLRATNTMLDKMWVTMSNTMRWQISANVLQGFMSTIQGAYSYAQDLNESLNNIRIVTGQSAEQMDRFAEKANKAAKALNASTTAYTDAALIYYQQGLSDKQVEERTNVTVKLANVVGENAQTVSEWMTSIWNNFDNGSKSLEYYADVLTALGAATASSSDEIAGGLEKFAAIAETVGLSYEYAATALATITAETRQSEDVVGTALKTIFARIQDLELGKTLDDGTSLGQYSEALSKIGVEVLDTSGNLREMDKVLNDMGSKWKTLSEAQKVATAQGVAGIRQYSQLIALMDNWDTFQLNLDVATNAEGTLQEQADIFAESWEAASKRVKAAAEDLYDDLLKDDFFIGLTDSFGYLLNGIGEVIDAMGGLKGLLPLLIAGFTKLFGEKMLVSIKNFSNSMKLSSASAQQMALSTKQEALNLMQAYAGDSHAGSLEVKELELQKKIYDINRMLTDEEQKQVQLWFDQLSTIRSVVAELEKMSQTGKQQQNQFNDAVAQAGPLSSQGQPIYGAFATTRTKYQARVTKNAEMAMLEAARFDADMVADSKEDLRNKVLDSKHDFAGKSDIQNQASLATADADDKLFEFNEDTQKWKMKNNALDKEATIQTQKLSKAYSGYNKQIDNFDELLNDKIAGMKKDAKATVGAEKAAELYEEELNNVDENIKQLSKTPLSNSIMATVQSISSLAMGLSSITTGISTFIEGLQEGEMSLSSFLGLLMSVSMGIPMLITGLQGLATNQLLLNGLTSTTIGLKAIENGMLKKQIADETVLQVLQKAGLAADTAELVLQEMKNGATLKEALYSVLKVQGKKAETDATWKHVAALIAEKAAMGPVMWIIMAIMAAVAIVTAGFIALFNIIQNSSAEAKLAAEKEQLNEMNSALEETKNKYNELKSAIENYEASADALKTMVKGTEEWKEAVIDLNAQVLDLISKYPELAQFLTSEDGVLTLGKEGLKKAQELAYDAVQDQTTAVLSQKALVAEMQQSLDWQNTKSNNKLYSNYGEGQTGNYRYETDNGEVYLGESEASYNQFFDEMKSLYDKFGQDLFTNNDEVKSEIGKLNKTYQTAWNTIKTDSEFQAVLTGFDTLANELKALATSIAMSELGDNSIYLQSKYQDAIANQYSDKINNALKDKKYNGVQRDEWLKYLIKNYDSTDNAHGDVQNAENIKKAGLTGINNKEDLAKWIVARKTGYSVNEIGTGSSNVVQIDQLGGDTLKYKGPDDDEWKAIDYEDYAQQLWTEYVTQQENSRVQEMSDQAEAIGKKIADAGIKDQSQISSMVADYVAGNTIDLTGLTRKEISEIDTSKMDAELQEAFDEAIDGYMEARAEANKQASLAWIEETETREAAALADALEAAEMTTDDFNDYVKSIQKTKGVTEEIADEIARDSIKATNALTTINEVLKDQKEALLSVDKASPAYVSAINDIQSALTEWLGIELDDEVISGFVTDGTFQAALEKDTEAINKLHEAAAKQFVIDMDIEGLTNEETGANYFDILNQKIEDISNQDIQVGATLDDTEFINTLNEMLESGLVTADQVSGYLNSIGYDPDITTKKLTTTQSYTISGLGILAGGLDGTSTITTETTSEVPVINAKGTTYTGKSAPTITPASSDSSGKSSKKDTKKASDEIDRYHEIKEVMEDLENEANKLSKAKERAFGANKLALMDKELAKQEELLQKEKEYLAEIEKHYGMDRNTILSNYNVTLDKQGRISNYDEVYNEELNRYNNAVNAYNKGSMTEENFEKAEEAYEKFKEDIEQYEETLNLLEDQQQAVIDKQNELADLALEKIEYKVQIKVDIADDDKAYLDFLMQKVEDDAFAAAEAISYLGKEAQLTLDKIKANEEGIAEVERALAAGDITPEQAVEKMREYRDELVDLNADLLEIRQTVQDKLTEAFEGWNEEIERGITKLEHYGSVLENYKNIIDIVGKDMLGISDETMSNLSKAQIANANNVIRATKAQLDANNSTLEKMRQSRAEAEARGDEESVKEWDKQIKVAEEKSQELAATLQEALSNSLQLAADDFALTVEQIADSFSKAVSGTYDDIEDMREGWDRMQEIADRYLETYEKTYEISKLNRKIQDSIDKTDNIASQKELRDLQNEMYEMTKDGQQLSKYDLEYLQKKYDLLVAEQAFKDAQNAKSVVRLQRDNEGNFGYVYTADQGTVDNAEQNYEDKLYAFQEYTHKMDEELAEMYISVQEQAYERMQAAAEMYGEGTEAFERERQKILEQYNIDMGYITDEYEKLTNRNLDINERFNAGVADTYEKTFISSIVPQYQSFEQLYDETTTQCEVSCARLDEAIILLQRTFDKQLELAGKDLDEFEEIANKELEKVQEDSSITASQVEDMASRMDIALSSSISAVENFQTTYSTQMQIIRNANQQTIESVNSLIQKYQEMINKSNEAAKVDLSATGNATASTSGGGASTSGGGASPSGSSNTSVPLTNSSEKSNDFKWTKVATHNYNGENFEALGRGDKEFTAYLYRRQNKDYVKSGSVSRTFTERELDNLKWKIVNDQIYNGKNGLYVLASALEDNKKSGVYKGQEWLIPTNNLNKWGRLGWITIDSKGFGGAGAGRSFDTGGYTGEWGPEGRLAMLHQKEIVLNAHDTENFLAAIGIVRDINDQIEKNAIVMQYQNQLANYRTSVGNSGETLQQEVHITAEFPNATDHNEIEEAFKNLTNLASQYANRK